MEATSSFLCRAKTTQYCSFFCGFFYLILFLLVMWKWF